MGSSSIPPSQGKQEREGAMALKMTVSSAKLSNEILRKMAQSAPLNRLLEKARRDQDILAVLVYGSSARQEQTKNSDIDICLVLRAGQNESKGSVFSPKRLDYLKEFPFDIRIFQQLPLFIRRRVLKEAKILFVRDNALLYELAVRTIKSFEDFKHIYYSYLDGVRSAR